MVWRQTRTKCLMGLVSRYFKGTTDCSKGIGELHLNSSAVRHQITSEASWNNPQWMPKALDRRKTGAGSSGTCNSSLGQCKNGNIVGLMPPQRESFTWTALISQHTKCGQSRQALRIYQEMLEGGVKPNSYTFVAVLKACSSLQDLESARQVHAEVVESGFLSDVYVGTMLVDTYGKCGSLVDARLVFEMMSHRDIVSWNAMIWGCVQMGNGEEALKLYTWMQQEGVIPDSRTFVGALKACSALSDLEEGHGTDGNLEKSVCLERVRAIHSHIVKHRSESAVFVGNMLVDLYAKCGSLEDARCVFENMRYRDVVSWNAMISGYAQLGSGEEALQLYARMQQDCIVPDARTFLSAVKACSVLVASEEMNLTDGKYGKEWCLEQVREIHSQKVQGGSEMGVFLGTMLMDVYAKCGSMVDSRSVFEKLPHRDVVSWNAMILGYCQIGEGEEALKLYTQMQQEGILPTDRTFLCALRACCSLPVVEDSEVLGGVAGRVKTRWLEQVRMIHSQVVQSRYHSAVYVGNMLVDVYAKCGSLVDSRSVFENMPHRDVVSWNTMLLGYVEMGNGAEALELYGRMQQEGVVSDDRTVIAALKACSLVAALEKGKEIHAQILETGHESTGLFVPTALIDMYAKCGHMENAQNVFDALTTRSIVTWSALIAGYANQGESEVVFDLYERMKLEGMQPNGTIFLSILTVCSHLGLLDKGQKYFEAMSKDSGITPTIAHFTCLVDLLGRGGHLDKAMALVKAMPCQADGVLWQTLLSACRKWGNVELGKEAFEGALRLDKNDSAAYVLMSNIYAAAHMGQDASQIQATRLKTGALKQPGQSWWTDVCGVVHAFAVGDRGHPEILAICAKVQDIGVKLMEEAYMPRLTCVAEHTA